MMQKLYQLWIVLLVISGGVATCFFGFAASELWKFFNCNQTQTAKTSEFEITSLPSSRVAICVHYTYEVDSVPYKGKTLLSSPQFFNRFAAENYIPSLLHKSWQVHYAENNPAKSSLEHLFPYKECVQTLVTLAVFLYFYFAKGLLRKYLEVLPSQ